MQVQSLGQEDPLEHETATHSSLLAWTTPRAEESGGLQSRGRTESDTTEPACMRLLAVSVENPSTPLSFRKETVTQT